MSLCFFFQAEDGIRDYKVTGVQTCALPICADLWHRHHGPEPAHRLHGPDLARPQRLLRHRCLYRGGALASPGLAVLRGRAGGGAVVLRGGFLSLAPCAPAAPPLSCALSPPL